jgi:hypothetical protein
VLNVVSACDLVPLGGMRYPERRADLERSFRVLRSLPADIWVTCHLLRHPERARARLRPQDDMITPKEDIMTQPSIAEAQQHLTDHIGKVSHEGEQAGHLANVQGPGSRTMTRSFLRSTKSSNPAMVTASVAEKPVANRGRSYYVRIQVTYHRRTVRQALLLRERKGLGGDNRSRRTARDRGSLGRRCDGHQSLERCHGQDAWPRRFRGCDRDRSSRRPDGDDWRGVSPLSWKRGGVEPIRSRGREQRGLNRVVLLRGAPASARCDGWLMSEDVLWRAP